MEQLDRLQICMKGYPKSNEWFLNEGATPE